MKFFFYAAISFLVTVYGFPIEKQSSFAPFNETINSTVLLEDNVSLTNEHWQSLRDMVKSGNTQLLAILQAANPKTVTQILKLLFSLIKRNQASIHRYGKKVTAARTRFLSKKKLYDRSVGSVNAKKKQLGLWQKEKLLIIKKISGAQGEVGILTRRSQRAKAYMSLAKTSLSDAEKVRRKNKGVLSSEIALIRQIIAMVKKLLPCPIGWAFHKKSCYRSFQSKLSWLAAENRCLRFGRGAHLAKLEGVSCRWVYRNIVRRRGGEWWAGGRSLAGNKPFKWISDRTLVKGIHWGPREPLKFVKKPNRCISFMKSGSHFYAHAELCDKRHHFICKMPIV